MKKERITWEFMTPNRFPCIHCDEGEAVWICHVSARGIVANLALCEECVGLDDGTLIDGLFKHGREKCE